MSGQKAPVNAPGRSTAVVRRTLRGQATMEALLEAAVACLLERGIVGTTVAEIAARAGVSPGLFVRCWPTKAALFAAAADLAQRRTLARFEDLWGSDPEDIDQLEQIRVGIDRIVAVYAEPEMRCLAELEGAARTDPRLSATVLPITEAIDEMIRQTARRLAPAEALSERFDDSVRVVIDTARGVSSRTAHAPPAVAARERQRVADALAALVGLPPRVPCRP
jgi:AcrR family transcriptional regulator